MRQWISTLHRLSLLRGTITHRPGEWGIPRLRRVCMCLRVGLLACMVFVLWPAAVRADDAHHEFTLSVDAPASATDSFHVHVTDTLVGAKPGVQVSITYKIVAIDPGGEEHILLGPVSQTSSLGGGQQRLTAGYWPRQNGEFVFRVVQLNGSRETIVAEQRATTDNAAVLAPASPPNTRPDGQFTIVGLRTDPVQPVAGQPVIIEVDATNFSPESVTRSVPVVFADDGGEQLLATGTFTLGPGLSGTGQWIWTPPRATSGLLEAGDQSVPIAVLDRPVPPPADSSEQPIPTDNLPDDSAGD